MSTTSISDSPFGGRGPTSTSSGSTAAEHIGPTTAERARTIAVAADSLSLAWESGRIDLVGRHHTDPRDGSIVLALPPGSALAHGVLTAPDGDLPAVLEFTDVCPVSVRRRTRARLTLGCWLSPLGRAETGSEGGEELLAAAPGSLLVRAELGEIRLDAGGRRIELDLADYEAARPDPFAADEAEHLQHLATHHDDAIAALSRLLEHRVTQHALRILPTSLTRYGLVLRVERQRGDDDVLLRFRRVLDSASDVGVEIGHLLVEAVSRPCRPRLG